jgi:hypothetical protein
VAPRKLLSASAADAKLQGALVGRFKGLRGGAVPASAVPVADAALGAGYFSQAQAAEKAKTMMAGHKDKKDKAMEGAKARAAEQQTDKAKAVENAKTMMASHAAKAMEGAKARAAEQETTKAKAVENAKTMMAGHKDKMAKAMEGAKARAFPNVKLPKPRQWRTPRR